MSKKKSEKVEKAPIVEKIEELNIADKLRSSFLDYSMSVIVSRAIPDVRDGLKPVHRRILWSAFESGFTPDKPFKKSARIVGDVMAKYHPHGDSSIYDALVRMAQEFSMRVPLINGHGNFGSIDGDAPAAMRYTESKLHGSAMELLREINKDTVNFVPNYDGSETQPSVLPARFPNLLVNGTEGIAVGMATKMPPHNLKEVCEATIAMIENPELTLEEIMEIIPGPDFPTAAMIMGTDGIYDAYRTGRGSVLIRGVTEIEETERKTRIIITELPYQVNKAKFFDKLVEIQQEYNDYKKEKEKKGGKTSVKEKGLDYLQDVRDESNRLGIRVVIDLKRGVNPHRVLNYLYKHTDLQQSFSIINLALVPQKSGEVKPEYLTLPQILKHYIKHQKEVVTRATKYDLKKAETDIHNYAGLMKALDDLDKVIAEIRASKNGTEAQNRLIELLEIDRGQAKYILDRNLQTLAQADQEKYRKAHDDIAKEIEKFKRILADEKEVLQIIKDDLKEIIEKHGTDRLTRIMPPAEEIDVASLIPDDEVVVTITRNGLIKRTLESTYRSQRRKGRGVSGMDTYDDDFVEHLQVAKNHDTLLFFTNRGQVYKTKVYEIQELGRTAKGISVTNLLQLDKDEKIQAVLSIREFSEKQYLFFSTKNGTVKKTELSRYANIRKSGIAAITLKEKDEVVGVYLTNGDRNVTLVTENGISITFPESDVNSVGRTGSGVKGIDLADKDQVISFIVHEEGADLLVATDEGYGKRTSLSEFRVQGRGGKGVIAIKMTEKNGHVIGTHVVQEKDALMFITKNGTLIKMLAEQISQVGRIAQGNVIINLRDGDVLQAVARLADAGDVGEEGFAEDEESDEE